MTWLIDSFIHRELESAGSDRVVFNQDTVEEIHRISGGVPRRIWQLAELALIAGAGQELERIDAETVAAVQEELQNPLSVAAH